MAAYRDELGGYGADIGGLRDEQGGFRNDIGGSRNDLVVFRNELGGSWNDLVVFRNEPGGSWNEVVVFRNELGGPWNDLVVFWNELGGSGNDVGPKRDYAPAMLDFLTHPHRAALRETPLSDAQRAIVEKNVASFASFDAADQAELVGLMQVFLAEKSFEGCGGLELTEEMKVTIAAEACILLLHRETAYYPDVESILVYPAAYRVRAKRHDGAVVVEGDEDRLGESWSRGTVVLAWDHVKADAGRTNNAHNLVLHEFAHQLDGEDGDMNGVPDLGRSSRYGSWGHVLAEEFEELTSSLYETHGKHSDIDAYGATNPSEFFAVVTEMFFGKPAAMKERHPALYEQLAEFYKQDPAARGATA